MDPIQELQAARTLLVRHANKIREDAGDELTDENLSAIEAKLAEVTALDDEIAKAQAAADKRAETLASLDAAKAVQPRRTAGAVSAGVTDVKEAWQNDPKKGYADINAFLKDVCFAATGRSGQVANHGALRMMAAAGSDEHNTQSDPHGGYLVPEGLLPGVQSIGSDADPTVGRVRNVPMDNPTLKVNARNDKNHASSVSGGLTVTRRAETQQGSSSRMALEQITLDASMLWGLAYITEEQLQDAPTATMSMISAGFGDEFDSKVFQEKIRGTGVGEMTGIINAPCTVSVAKESMQDADTINGTNLKNMRSRAWRYSGANYVWLANADCYPQLSEAHITLTNDDVPVYVPGNGVDVPDTIFGAPVIYNEHMSTVGDLGDIVLARWDQYLVGEYSPMQSAESIHVRFENHERALKFFKRNDGKPWWRVPLTPAQSTTTLSPFITLAERA